MTSKHYKWQKNWTLDTDAATLTHDSGLAVVFSSARPNPVPEVGAHAWTPDGRQWFGLIVGGMPALEAWLAVQFERGLRDRASVAGRVSRLMREAGELWADAQDDQQ